MATAACVFCAIVAGDATPDVVAWRDHQTVVLPSLHQQGRNRGHMLVVPAAHVPNIYGIDHHLGGALLATVSAVSLALKRAWRADGVSVRQNNDAHGGQDVFHVHFHVIPRFANDGFDLGDDRFPFGALEVPLEERVAQSARLREELGAGPRDPVSDLRIPAGRAVLRHWGRDDAAALAAAANDRRVWLGMRDAFPQPYAEEDGRRFIATATAMSPQTYFAIEAGGAVAGGIGYTLKTDVERIGAEVGYWLGVDFWGRGIAADALRALTRHAFATHPELRRLWAVPYASNAASARVLEKAGFVREGTLRQSAIKDGRVLDQRMYAILRDDVMDDG